VSLEIQAAARLLPTRSVRPDKATVCLLLFSGLVFTIKAGLVALGLIVSFLHGQKSQ
jgi:hypothetical protein